MKLLDQSAKTNWKFIAIVALVTLLLGGGAWWYGRMLNEADLAQEQNYVRDLSSEGEQESETAGWQTYRNEEFGFEVKYPDFVEFQEKDNGFSLKHSVDFLHGNPCDFIGDGSILNQLTDFSMNVEIIATSFEKAIKRYETSYLTENFFQGNSLKEEQGFIDRIKAGELEGYKITSGV